MGAMKRIIFLLCSLWVFPAWATVTNVASIVALNSAISTASPGDTIILADGTYTGANINFTANGSAGQLITMQSQTSGGVILTGDNTYFTLSGSYLVLSGFTFSDVDTSSNAAFRLMYITAASYCRVTDCSFIRVGRIAASAHIIDVWDTSHHNRIDNCLFDTIYGIGIENKLLGGAIPDLGNIYNTYDHLTFRDAPDSSQKEAIQVGRGSAAYLEEFATPAYVIIEWCIFERQNGDNELISIKAANNTIRYNFVKDCNAVIKLRGGDSNTVHSNWITHSIENQGNEVGVAVYGTNAKVINNYVYGTLHGVQLYTGDGGVNPNVVNAIVANNVIVETQFNGIQIGNTAGTQPDNCRVINNIVQMSSVAGGPPKCYNEYAGSTNITYDINKAWIIGVKTEIGVTNPGVVLTNPFLATATPRWSVVDDYMESSIYTKGAFIAGYHDQPGCIDSAGIPCNSMAIPLGANLPATAQPTYHGPRH